MIIVGLDTETTGLDTEQGHRIVELCLMKVDTDKLGPDGSFEVLETYEQRFNPGRPIDAKAMEVHHITNGMLTHCPKFVDEAKKIAAFLEDADLLVAHNMMFDAPFLACEMLYADIEPTETETFCTLEESRWATYDGKSPKLSELCFALGVEYDPAKAHSALYDVVVMMQCLKRGIDQGCYKLT